MFFFFCFLHLVCRFFLSFVIIFQAGGAKKNGIRKCVYKIYKFKFQEVTKRNANGAIMFSSKSSAVVFSRPIFFLATNDLFRLVFATFTKANTFQVSLTLFSFRYDGSRFSRQPLYIFVTYTHRRCFESRTRYIFIRDSIFEQQCIQVAI